MKLISMVDFVLTRDISRSNCENALCEIEAYAKFLKQPLTLGMFVPCVDNEPFNYSKHGNSEQFEKAKEKVLFEGFSLKEGSNKIIVNNNTCWNVDLFSENCTDFITIEDLVSRNPLLTKNALKQIGL